MKVINEKDYDYVGYDKGWFIFRSRPKENFDPEMIYVKRVRFIKEDGQSIYYEEPQKKLV